MLLEEALKAQIRTEEGWRPVVYDDATGLPIIPGTPVKGHPTIGYGFALDVAGLDRSESEWILDRRISRLLGDLSRRVAFWNLLSPVRQLALAQMAYQLGVDGLLSFTHALQSLGVSDYDRAAAEFLNSKWARSDSPARAARVVEMIRTGQLPGEESH